MGYGQLDVDIMSYSVNKHIVLTDFISDMLLDCLDTWQWQVNGRVWRPKKYFRDNQFLGSVCEAWCEVPKKTCWFVWYFENMIYMFSYIQKKKLVAKYKMAANTAAIKMAAKVENCKL